jgi:hypothetical protein
MRCDEILNYTLEGQGDFEIELRSYGAGCLESSYKIYKEESDS